MNKKLYFSFVFVAVLVAGFFILSYQKKISVISKTEQQIKPEPLAFLLLGKTGKIIGWNQSPDLADAIILVDYRPNLGVVNLVSLPRDLYFDFNGESAKLNEVTRLKKINELLDKLPEISGIETDKYVIVDIDSLKAVVDALGGIDLEVREKAVDWVSGFSLEPGQQYLNGEKAVWLARNRFSPEGDFFREKNQHDIIKAILDKYEKLNPVEKASFMFKIFPEIVKTETNVDFQQLLPGFEKTQKIRFNDVVLDFSTGLLVSATTTIGNSIAYILLPKNGPGEYDDIRKYIQSRLEK